MAEMKRRSFRLCNQFYKILHEKYMSLYNDYDNDLLYQIYGIDDIDFTVEDLPRGADKDRRNINCVCNTK